MVPIMMMIIIIIMIMVMMMTMMMPLSGKISKTNFKFIGKLRMLVKKIRSITQDSLKSCEKLLTVLPFHIADVTDLVVPTSCDIQTTYQVKQRFSA
jgi:hypothetical protein